MSEGVSLLHGDSSEDGGVTRRASVSTHTSGSRPRTSAPWPGMSRRAVGDRPCQCRRVLCQEKRVPREDRCLHCCHPEQSHRAGRPGIPRLPPGSRVLCPRLRARPGGSRGRGPRARSCRALPPGHLCTGPRDLRDIRRAPVQHEGERGHRTRDQWDRRHDRPAGTRCPGEPGPYIRCHCGELPCGMTKGVMVELGLSSR